MTDNDQALKSGLPHRRRRRDWKLTAFHLTGLGFAGLWLVLLVITTVCVTVVVFGATQFQTRLGGLSIGGAQFSVWKAALIREQWASSLDALDSARRTLSETRHQLSNVLSIRVEAEKRVANAQRKLQYVYEDILTKISKENADAASNFRNRSELILDAAKFEPALSKVIEDAGIKSLASEKAAVIDAHREFMKEYFYNENLKTGTQRLEQVLKNEADAIDKALAATSTLGLPPGVPAEQRAQIENAIYEFHSLENFLNGVVYKLSLAPSDILVLLLVVAMGVLGSSLQLSYIFATEFADRPTSYYVFRPFLGIITALVIFIVAKAGAPIITDSTRFGGNVPINPYFISFLAIISGFLSERALESLRQLGSTYFRSGDQETPRWARDGLREQFKLVDRDPHELRSTADLRQEDIDSWVDGKVPVPALVQTLFSAIVKKSRRDLFTDIPPAQPTH